MVTLSPVVSRSFLALALFAFAGCSDLILRDTDTPEETAGKVTARVLLCPMTLCLSEFDIAMTKAREAREQREARYWRWVHSLSPEEQERHYRLEESRIQAAGQALLGLGIGGGLFRNTTAPTAPLYQPSPVPALPFAAPTAPVPPVSCSSRQVGSVVHTDCY